MDFGQITVDAGIFSTTMLLHLKNCVYGVNFIRNFFGRLGSQPRKTNSNYVNISAYFPLKRGKARNNRGNLCKGRLYEDGTTV